MAEAESQTFPDSTLVEIKLANRRGSVLSDQDIKTEIAIRRLVYTEPNSDCSEGIKGDCYDFRISHAIDKKSGVRQNDDRVLLKPGDLVTLLSQEFVKLPKNIAGLVIPRNLQAQRGLLILNAGHVEPGYEGQIMAQVVNLSDHDRSIQLNNSKNGVFSIVFSYVHTRAENLTSPKNSAQERVSELLRDVGEQAETLVMAESTMREKFVAQDAFTRLLWLNALGLLIMTGVVAGLLALFFNVNDLSQVGLDRKSLFDFGKLTFSVVAGVAMAHGFVLPLFSIAWNRFRRRSFR